MDNAVFDQIDAITKRLLNGGEMTADEGRWMIQLDDDYLPWMMAGADRLRKTFCGEQIEVCAISNVRSGNCSEDCSFCSQSGHHETAAPVYNYISKEKLSEQAQRARSWGVSDFGVVSKGWGIRSDRERSQLKEYFDTLDADSDIGRCASLGVLNDKTAKELSDMGLENYHHNLETAQSFFHNVCTTHSYQENIDTIIAARDAGLRVCSGGILGMGETRAQRVELAETLRKIGVDSVPLNFLNPQQGTPMGGLKPLEPMEILKSIATFRYMLPKADIRIAGGRQFLGDMQSMIFMAGASGVMIGDYLTTQGRQVEDDLAMLDALKLKPREGTQKRRAAENANP